jgi:hypothetical protein
VGYQLRCAKILVDIAIMTNFINFFTQGDKFFSWSVCNFSYKLKFQPTLRHDIQRSGCLVCHDFNVSVLGTIFLLTYVIGSH